MLLNPNLQKMEKVGQKIKKCLKDGGIDLRKRRQLS
jgi:hypothetical protein